MKKEIMYDLNHNNKSGIKTREIYIKKKFPDDYKDIIKILDVDCWYEKLYWYVYDYNSIPKCKNSNCSNQVKFKGYSKGYNQYCSVKCRNTDNNLIDKIKFNMLDKYGVDNPMKINDIKEKVKKTKKERYGNENFINIQKIKKTKKDRYNNEFYNNREKAIKTSINKFGNKNINNRIKAKQTMIDKYGVDVYSKSNNFCNKVRETYKNKTSVEINEIVNKRKKTMFNKYGSEHFSQSIKSKLNKINKQIKNQSIKLNISSEQIEYDLDNKIFKIKKYCKIHDEFEIDYYVLKNRLLYNIENICTKCNPVNQQSSIKEKEIVDFINSLDIKFNKNDRKILMGKEIDLYLPNHNLAIEFNGLYWHSNKFIDKNYHLNKTEECENKGIQLLHIFEDEWIFKKEIVESIIKSKLGIINNKIYGRKTEIKEINDNKLIRNFLETNHIQGFVGSSVKIGLFYKNELVSLMTFGKKRISMGNKSSEDGEYEMLRFCNKLNTQVIGGASKLLKYFIRNYNPKSIITFADRRYSNGNLYKQLGFKFEKNTKPNYWYFKIHEYILHYRFKFRKDILVKEGFDKNKTESQIMYERGYLKIYDSGNMKFILKLE